MPSDERPEFEIDENPGVADELPFWPRDERADESDRAVALEDPVGGGGEDEEDANQNLECLRADLEARTNQLGRRGEVAQPLLECDEYFVLDARRVLGRLGEVVSRGRNGGDAKSRLNLPERSRHDKPGEQGDQPDNGQIVDRHANALRDAPSTECLDSGAHRSGEHEAKEHQRHDKPQLPDADADDGDAENDERGDSNAACSVREISPRAFGLGWTHNVLLTSVGDCAIRWV